MTPYQFFDSVRAYCYATGASVTSYGRTRARQAMLDPKVRIGPHPLWLGADVVYDDKAPQDADELARRLGLKLLREDDHDHLQPLDLEAG